MTKQQRLRILRILAGYDRKDLARSIEVCPSTITLWESDKKKLDISSFSLLKLGELFGVNPDYLENGPQRNQHILNTVWQPKLPNTPQHRRATIATINSLFPEFLQDMGFNLGVSVKLRNGEAYLLGDRELKEFKNLVLVKETYTSLFDGLFTGYKNILFLPPVELLGCSIDGLNGQSLKKVSIKFGEMSIAGIAKALDQYSPRGNEEEIQINLIDIEKKMNNFLTIILKGRPEEDHISELTGLFIKTLKSNQPEVSAEYIQQIISDEKRLLV